VINSISGDMPALCMERTRSAAKIKLPFKTAITSRLSWPFFAMSVANASLRAASVSASNKTSIFRSRISATFNLSKVGLIGDRCSGSERVIHLPHLVVRQAQCETERFCLPVVDEKMHHPARHTLPDFDHSE